MILGLAPMDGITDCAYRYITKCIFDQYNKNSNNELWLWTEFMNINGYLINPSKVLRHMLTISTDTPTIAQIYGGNDDKLLEAALQIEKDYANAFSGLELNIGCPSPKVMAGGGGSGMLRDKRKTLETIKILSKKLSLPFSIKTRSGLNQEDKKEQFEFIIEASKYCDMIVIHGRTLKQSHSGDVDWEFIEDVKNEVGDGCKIVGNGGVKQAPGTSGTSYNQSSTTAQITPESPVPRDIKLDGIMIGQATIGNPWIFTGDKPPLDELRYWILEHLHTVMACELFFDEQGDPESNSGGLGRFVLKMFPENEISSYIKKAISMKDRKFFSVIEFRKFLFNYVKGIPGSKDFKVKVSRINEYEELRDVIEDFFSSIPRNDS